MWELFFSHHITYLTFTSHHLPHLAYTGSPSHIPHIHWVLEELEYPKIETRLIDEKFVSVMGECVI